MTQKLLMGNEAIGRALVEAGCSFISAYPGTPSSEVLEAVVANLAADPERLHVQWSVNEKVAYESALAASYTGKRAAVIMKQVGLNVAADPFARSTYIGVKGGFVVVVADDPGPHSSQNEQDTRLFALFAKAPVFDPSSPAEAREMVTEALELSERYELPVLLRPTTRICHSRQNITLRPPHDPGRRAAFEKNPGRWVATPAFLPGLHAELNRKLARIAAENSFQPQPSGPPHARHAIVASGIAYANLADLLEEMQLADRVCLYQVRLPFPLHQGFARELAQAHEKILVIEETDAVIEMQLAGDNISGRRNGTVPGHGELTPDSLETILRDFLELPADSASQAPSAARGRRPSLCPGCPHRASFFAIRKTFPKGIFPSDIGCYTLGGLPPLSALHACVCMGAGICMAHGATMAGAPAEKTRAIIGDSTFMHSGITGVMDIVYNKGVATVIVLDNSTTAMTGKQDHPGTGVTLKGEKTKKVSIEEICRAVGVERVRYVDPYDLEETERVLQEELAAKEPSVVITTRPCTLITRERPGITYTVDEERCIGCGKCSNVACMAVFITGSNGDRVAKVDPLLCYGCGVCAQVCPVDAILPGNGSN